MPNEERQATCEERVEAAMEGRLSDLRLLWKEYTGEDMEPDELAEFCSDFGRDEPDQDEPAIYEYGLAFDYVAPETFTDQLEPYWRYQLSWGGPSDEFRFYSGGPQVQPYRITYWFLDWYDGAGRTLAGDDRELLLDYWQWFADTETTDEQQRQAMED